MKKACAFAVSMLVVAAACGGSDSEGSGDTVAPDVTEPGPAASDPPATEPAGTEPADTSPVEETQPETTPAPETTAAPTTTSTTTEPPPPPVAAVGLVPLPGEQLDFTAQSIDAPTLVWSMYSGSGGIVVENLGGPIPPGCHGTSFFDPSTFELLQIDGADAHAYATSGQGGCDNMQQDLEEGVVDGDAVKVNDEHIIQFDFGALPPSPFEVSTQIVDPDGANGIFRSSDPAEPLPITDLADATHAVGVSGIYEVDQDDSTLRWLDLPAPAAGSGCEATSLCLSDRFQVDIVDPSGSPASVIISGDNGGRFYFFGAHHINILVSVLNACELNNNFWVFAAATTSVEYDLTVTDTASGEATSYSDRPGALPGAILDTEAFATCP